MYLRIRGIEIRQKGPCLVYDLKIKRHFPDNKVHGANMGPIWGRQDPGGPQVGPMKLAVWVGIVNRTKPIIDLFAVRDFSVFSTKCHWHNQWHFFVNHPCATYDLLLMSVNFILYSTFYIANVLTIYVCENHDMCKDTNRPADALTSHTFCPAICMM